MWAQEWQGIFDLVQPYKDVKEPNYNEALSKHLMAKLTDKSFPSEKEKLLGKSKFACAILKTKD